MQLLQKPATMLLFDVKHGKHFICNLPLLVICYFSQSATTFPVVTFWFFCQLCNLRCSGKAVLPLQSGLNSLFCGLVMRHKWADPALSGWQYCGHRHEIRN